MHPSLKPLTTSGAKHPRGILVLFWMTAAVLVNAGSLPLTRAQDGPPSGNNTPRLQVRQLEGTLHALGDLRFDLAKRTVRFPATVNMNEGAIEFALVGTQGKIHESVFATEIRPMHLRAVLSLLNFEPSAPKKIEGDAKASANKPSLVEIHVSWQDLPAGEPNNKKKRVPMRECIVIMEFERLSEFDEKVHLRPLPKGPWNYTGSRFDDYGFEAERELDFIAVQHRPSALINLPHPNSDRDDLWQANPKVLPEIGTPVTIEITLPPAKE